MRRLDQNMSIKVTFCLILTAGKDYSQFLPVHVYKDIDLPGVPVAGLRIYDSITKIETDLIVDEVAFDINENKYIASIILSGFTGRKQAEEFARMGANYHNWHHYLDAENI